MTIIKYIAFVYIFAIILIIRFASNRKKNTGNVKNKPVKSTPRVQEKISRLEPEGDDWLSRQIREEAEAKKKMDEMFMLKREHAADCDAEKTRREHVAKHGKL